MLREHNGDHVRFLSTEGLGEPAGGGEGAAGAGEEDWDGRGETGSEGGGGRTTLPSTKRTGPLGISPISALAASSSAGSSSNFQSSSPP